MSPRSRQFLFLGGIILLAGAGLRLSGLWNALEYDEIWSLEGYTGKPCLEILTDLALPNNHPLNSLWLKYAAEWNSFPLLRLHSFLSGLGTILAGGWFALYWGKCKRGALWTMACLAVSSPLIFASAQARGYSLQTFFVTLFGASLVAMRPELRLKKFRCLPEVLLLAAGIGAIWSLSSSALFLFPVTLAALYSGWRKRRCGERNISGLAALGCFGLFTLCWYGKYWEVMRGAQNWAVPVTDVRMFLFSIAGILCALGFPLWCFLAVLLWRRNRIIALIAAFPLVAAIWTHLGPSRVYMPLIPAFAMMTGYAAARCRKWGWLIFGLWLTLSISQWKMWKGTDWFSVFEHARQRPVEELVIHTATAGFPLARNNPDAREDFLNRMAAVVPGPRKLLLAGSRDLNGINEKGSEEIIARVSGTPEKLGDTPALSVTLLPLKTAPQKEGLVIALIPPVRQELFRTLLFQLKTCGTIWQLNRWLIYPLQQNGGNYQYGLIVLRVQDPEKWPPEFPEMPPEIMQLYHVEAQQ